jgi:hypothetical protein
MYQHEGPVLSVCWNKVPKPCLHLSPVYLLGCRRAPRYSPAVQTTRGGCTTLRLGRPPRSSLSRQTL